MIALCEENAAIFSRLSVVYSERADPRTTAAALAAVAALAPARPSAPAELYVFTDAARYRRWCGLGVSPAHVVADAPTLAELTAISERAAAVSRAHIEYGGSDALPPATVVVFDADVRSGVGRRPEGPTSIVDRCYLQRAANCYAVFTGESIGDGPGAVPVRAGMAHSVIFTDEANARWNLTLNARLRQLLLADNDTAAFLSELARHAGPAVAGFAFVPTSAGPLLRVLAAIKETGQLQ